MPSIHLIIPVPALHDAITEQLALTKFGAAVDQTSLAEAVKDNDASLIILDESALDAKCLDFVASGKANAQTIFLLGGDGANLPDSIAEFFAKPIRLGHLLARIKYHLEVAPRLRGVTAEFHGMRFESQNRQLVVMATNAIIRLTEKETALLATLLQSPAAISREELLATIWGYGAHIDTHTLESHIYQLRRKMDVDETGAAILLNEAGAYRINRS